MYPEGTKVMPTAADGLGACVSKPGSELRVRTWGKNKKGLTPFFLVAHRQVPLRQQHNTVRIEAVLDERIDSVDNFL